MSMSVYFEGLFLGMEKCRARKQSFFVDSCRNVREQITELAGEVGDPIIRGEAQSSGLVARDAPIYYATAQDESAWGIAGKPSRFTDAVLKGVPHFFNRRMFVSEC